MATACVIFDTRYGSTEKIAKALETGLSGAGIQTVCTGVNEVVVDSLKGFDLICVGGPTQLRTVSETMRGFLESLSRVELAGKRAFAFETRRDSRFAGSAAKYIEEFLRKQGMEVVSQRQSAVIVIPELQKGKEEFASKDEWKEWKHKSEKLREGEEERFERIGVQVGRALLEAVSTIE